MGEYEQTELRKNKQIFAFVVVGILIFLIIVLGMMWGIPQYKVWQRGLKGEAALREAEFSKKVLVEQAKAELESAGLYADAEIARARGVAESMKIISEKLEKNENYLHYLAIQAQEKMADSPNHTTIYIPVGSNGIPLIKNLEE